MHAAGLSNDGVLVVFGGTASSIPSPLITLQLGCNVGSSSTDIFETPCRQCDKGKYAETAGLAECTSCLSKITTEAPGSTSATDCDLVTNHIGLNFFILRSPLSCTSLGASSYSSLVLAQHFMACSPSNCSCISPCSQFSSSPFFLHIFLLRLTLSWSSVAPVCAISGSLSWPFILRFELLSWALCFLSCSSSTLLDSSSRTLH